MRAKLAMGTVAKVMLGKIKWISTSPIPLLARPIPIAGSQPNCTEKSSTSMRPSQKTGMDTPINAPVMQT